MANFEEMTLHRINPPVTLHKKEQQLEIDGGTMRLNEWLAWSERVTTFLYREEVLPKPENTEAPRSHGSAPFLVQNISAMNTFKRGKIKRAPWFLRWLFDGIITKEEYHGNFENSL